MGPGDADGFPNRAEAFWIWCSHYQTNRVILVQLRPGPFLSLDPSRHSSLDPSLSFLLCAIPSGTSCLFCCLCSAQYTFKQLVCRGDIGPSLLVVGMSLRDMLSCPTNTCSVHLLRCRAIPSEIEHVVWCMFSEQNRNSKRQYKQINKQTNPPT